MILPLLSEREERPHWGALRGERGKGLLLLRARELPSGRRGNRRRRRGK
jgi:hypothetical protein